MGVPAMQSHRAPDIEGTSLVLFYFFNIYFCKDFSYLFLERGEGREKERETSDQLLLVQPQMGTWPAAQVCALTGDQTGDLSVHRLMLNQLSHSSQGPCLDLSATVAIFLQVHPYFHFTQGIQNYAASFKEEMGSYKKYLYIPCPKGAPSLGYMSKWFILRKKNSNTM